MPRGENRPSLLLSPDENSQVFSLIGSKCQSLATAVVQLFTTEGPAHSEWKKKDTGVLCLIKDNSKRSYFFRIYCLYRKAMIWEHEVYMQIEYKSPRPYLHTFEAEEYMTAFNFANEDEAKSLRNTLIEKIEMRKQRREERRLRSTRVNGVVTPPAPAAAPARLPAPAYPAPQPAPTFPAPQPAKTNTISGYTMKSSGKKSKTRKLTKADIGLPQDFKHVSHVGWNADKGFDVDLPEEEMRSFFSKAGVSETQLQDEPTRQFIYDFINTHGGIEAVKEELHDAKPPKAEVHKAAAAPPAPPVPARSPAPAHPPAPPSRAPPPPPARAVPPPPPPPASLQPPRNPPPPRPPQPPASGPPSVPPPPPPVPSGAVPPPPPPPAPAAPPPPPLPADSAPPPDARAALMQSIRSGNKNLKHVEVGSKTSLNDDSRSNLLSEIRQGIELRSVSRSSSNPGSARGAAEMGAASGLAGALARALQERSRAIHSSDDSDLSDATTSDGEWDDV